MNTRKGRPEGTTGASKACHSPSEVRSAPPPPPQACLGDLLPKTRAKVTWPGTWQTPLSPSEEGQCGQWSVTSIPCARVRRALYLCGSPHTCRSRPLGGGNRTDPE